MSQILLQKIKICQSIDCTIQLSRNQIKHHRRFCGKCKKIEARWYCAGSCGHVLNSITDSPHRKYCKNCSRLKANIHQNNKFKQYRKTDEGRIKMKGWSRRSYLVRAIKKLEQEHPTSKRLEIKREQLARVC